MDPDKTSDAAAQRRMMDLFDRVMDLSPAERVALLDRECADDPDMRRRVEALLESDTAFGDGGVTGAIGAGLDALIESTEPVKKGTRIGAYRIVDTLGHGGMGMVFLAERADRHFAQRVAIKVVSGLAINQEILARFRGERQILAALDHPYIAHLVDGGETDAGVPYLVMEYVEGEPIMQACRRLDLGLDVRIDLFLKICEAVQYAHQNLIVHRDLKPANIMVTADGFPKLLDFGIAKILDKRQFDQTMIETQDGQMLFTPDHAAPEQVLGKAVTTATDVYCLGILLYELLTGRRPFDFGDRRPGELERIICQQPPKLPSALAATLARGESDTGAGIELTSLPMPADRLRRRLRGDLDNIVLKALRKEPERRYASVAAMADDIRRYTQGLPVSARADTWRYRSVKFVQRNTLAVAAGVTLFAVAIAFAISMAVQAARIDKERQTAVQALSILVDLVRRTDPKSAQGESFSAVDLLNEWSDRVDDELANEPAIQATLMNTIGVAYFNLGQYEPAERSLRMALAQRERVGGEAEAQVRNHNDLADVLYVSGRYDDALAVFGDALATARAELVTDHAEISRALSGSGLVHLQLGAYDAAEPLFREAETIDRRAGRDGDDPVWASTLTGLGTITWRQTDLDATERLWREALEIRRRVLGNDHPDTMTSVNNLASILVDRGDLAGAEPLFLEALETNERILGSEHVEIAVNLNNLGYVRLTAGRFAEAEPVYRRSLAIDRSVLGDLHPDLAYGLNSLGMTLAGLGRLEDAEAQYREALALFDAQDHDHRLTGQVLANYAALEIGRGAHDEALRLARDAKVRIDAQFPDGHWRRAYTDSVLGEALVALGRRDEAEPLLTDSVEPIVSSMGPASIYASEARRRVALLAAGAR